MICPKCQYETQEYICTHCGADLITECIANRNITNDDILASYIKNQSIKNIYQTANGLSKEDVEDISQNTFLKVWVHIENLSNRTVQGLGAYIKITTKNTIYDFFSDQKISKSLDEEIGEDDFTLKDVIEAPKEYYDTEYIIENNEAIKTAYKVLSKELTETQYKYLFESLVNGKKYKDIAEENNTNVQTVKNNVFQARKKIETLKNQERTFIPGLSAIAIMFFFMHQDSIKARAATINYDKYVAPRPAQKGTYNPTYQDNDTQPVYTATQTATRKTAKRAAKTAAKISGKKLISVFIATGVLGANVAIGYGLTHSLTDNGSFTEQDFCGYYKDYEETCDLCLAPGGTAKSCSVYGKWSYKNDKLVVITREYGIITNIMSAKPTDNNTLEMKSNDYILCFYFPFTSHTEVYHRSTD